MSILKLELLSPAGDLTRLKYAFAYGADAVYLGLPDFSLRAKTGFDLESLKEGIEHAHKLKKKIYITINIFAHNKQIALLPDFLKKVKKLNPDAIIISDPGFLMLVKKHLPGIEVHLSTQMNVLNVEAVKFWHKNGVKRIILGREASLQDIKEIHKQVPKMELEVFVHGAMCMSYSGRCYLSAWLNERSANEGLCTQPCRWDYKLYMEEPLRPGMMIPLEEDEKGIYILNSKDLCLIQYLDQLAKAGVKCFKIEGRTKSHYYVSVVTKAYRQAIISLKQKNKSAVKKLNLELQKVDNRGYTTGFLFGDEGIKRQEFTTSKMKSDWQFVGEIISATSVIPAKAGIQESGSRLKPGMTKNQKINKVKQQIVWFKAHNMLKAGETFELLTPDNCHKIKIKEFKDESGDKFQEVHGGTDKTYSFKISKNIKIDRGLIRKELKKISQ